MRLTVTIDTENDAFTGSQFEPELTAVLNNVLGCVCTVVRPQLAQGAGTVHATIHDGNGNSCGTITAAGDTVADISEHDDENDS